MSPDVRRLLLDEGLPFTTAAKLRAGGIDAVHVKDVGLSSTPDSLILEYARNSGRTCVTLDLDFHQLLAASGASAPSVILLRFQRLRAEQATDLIATIVRGVGTDLAAGIAVTATRRGVRIRKLPLR
jgi:predicted nuclease of predicted toxin-antitoxin system